MHVRKMSSALWLMVISVVIGSATVLASAASAQTTGCGPGTGAYPPTAGNLQLSVTHDVPVTGTVTVSGSGFTAGSTVVLGPQGITPGTATANASGDFSVVVSLPPGTEAGNFIITATGRNAAGCLRENAQLTLTVLGTDEAEELHMDGGGHDAHPGEDVIIGANGCGPTTPVSFFFDDTSNNIGHTTSDSHGAFRGSLHIPNNATAGAHHILSVCEDPLTLSFAVTVAPAVSSAPLPVTGSNLRPWFAAIVVLLAVGTALVLVGRSRRGHRQS